MIYIAHKVYRLYHIVHRNFAHCDVFKLHFINNKLNFLFIFYSYDISLDNGVFKMWTVLHCTTAPAGKKKENNLDYRGWVRRDPDMPSHKSF